MIKMEPSDELYYQCWSDYVDFNKPYRPLTLNHREFLNSIEQLHKCKITYDHRPSNEKYILNFVNPRDETIFRLRYAEYL